MHDYLMGLVVLAIYFVLAAPVIWWFGFRDPDGSDDLNPEPEPGPEHVILVGFVVNARDRESAEIQLHQRLVPLLMSNDRTSPIDSWWVAEDDRRDRSDLDSAVFVRPGYQRTAVSLLRGQGLAW